MIEYVVRCEHTYGHVVQRKWLAAQTTRKKAHTEKSEEDTVNTKYLLITVDKSPITCSARSYQHRTAKHTYTQRRARV